MSDEKFLYTEEDLKDLGIPTKDKRSPARFYIGKAPFVDPDTGHEGFKPAPFIEIRHSKNNIIDTPVTNEHKKIYKDVYAHFVKSEEFELFMENQDEIITRTFTPLEKLAGMNAVLAKEFHEEKIDCIESLAEQDLADIDHIFSAKTFLERALKYIAEHDDVKVKPAVRKRALAANKPKRGRPKKEPEAA